MRARSHRWPTGVFYFRRLRDMPVHNEMVIDIRYPNRPAANNLEARSSPQKPATNRRRSTETEPSDQPAPASVQEGYTRPQLQSRLRHAERRSPSLSSSIPRKDQRVDRAECAIGKPESHAHDHDQGRRGDHPRHQERSARIWGQLVSERVHSHTSERSEAGKD